MAINFRTLTADDVETRAARLTEKGCQLLIYKNARTDMTILDATVGQENWQREHYECKGNLYCRVGIKCGDEWIWKSDCGSESNTEAEKGEASDSFKRACTNWGIGRELYSSPFIWIEAGKYRTRSNKSGKTELADRLDVAEMTVSGGKITSLVIVNRGTKETVYTFGKKETPKSASKTATKEEQKPKEETTVKKSPFNPLLQVTALPLTVDDARKYVLVKGAYPNQTLGDIFEKEKQYLISVFNHSATPPTVRQQIKMIFDAEEANA